MRIDLEGLLAPISEDSPAGEDLSDDNDRLAIDDLFESVQRDDFSGDEPNWRSVTEEVVGLAKRSRDIWLAVYICRAGAKLGDLEQVAGGAKLLAGLLQDWDAVYPTIEDVGAQGRKSRCSELSQRRAFLKALAGAPLVSDPRHGSFSYADLEGYASPEDADIGLTRIMEGNGKTQLAASIAHVDEIAEAIRAAEAAFRSHSDSTADWPEFGPLYEMLTGMRRVAAPWLGEDAAKSSGDNSAPDAPAEARPAPAGEPSAPGSIRSRDDVLRAIDAICGYYARHEPASPVPLALKRARGWVSLDFLSVLQDIAPDSLSDAQRVLMQTRRDDD